MKHDKSNTTFLYEIVITFCPFYLSETTYVIMFIQLEGKVIKVSDERQRSFHKFIDHLRGKQ